MSVIINLIAKIKGIGVEKDIPTNLMPRKLNFINFLTYLSIFLLCIIMLTTYSFNGIALSVISEEDSLFLAGILITILYLALIIAFLILTYQKMKYYSMREIFYKDTESNYYKLNSFYRLNNGDSYIEFTTRVKNLEINLKKKSNSKPVFVPAEEVKIKKLSEIEYENFIKTDYKQDVKVGWLYTSIFLQIFLSMISLLSILPDICVIWKGVILCSTYLLPIVIIIIFNIVLTRYTTEEVVTDRDEQLIEEVKKKYE